MSNEGGGFEDDSTDAIRFSTLRDDKTHGQVLTLFSRVTGQQIL
jgi:hypothetical protein